MFTCLIIEITLMNGHSLSFTVHSDCFVIMCFPSLLSVDGRNQTTVY